MQFSIGSYSACYILTGTIILNPIEENYSLHNFGVCTSGNIINILNSCFFIIPLTIRFLQCIRQIYEKAPRKSFFIMPFSLNAFKYVFGIILTLVQVFMPISHSKHNQFYIQMSFYIILTLFTTFWDIIMDWGLLSFLFKKVKINNFYFFILINLLSAFFFNF